MRSMTYLTGTCVLLAAIAAGDAAPPDPGAPPADRDPAWSTAHLDKPYMTAEQTRAFMKRLATFVRDNHLKRDPDSAQRGMVYEYFQVARKGKYDQWIQGEALDTMHDGAWYAAAMVNAFRATGDGFYKDFLADWQLPFYCRMLNHSDELFVSSATRNDAPDANPWGKPWAFQEGEKGFIPYWWDDGASVSIERTAKGEPFRPMRPSVNNLAGKPNPKRLLDGYSQGMSNHMAQDIGVMVQQAWLLFREQTDTPGRKLAGELADAAVNLHASRLRHHGYIPMCAAPAGLVTRNEKLIRRLPDPNHPSNFRPSNHYTRALRDYEPGKAMGMPGFADDQQYNYYHGLARTGGELGAAFAFRTVYDAATSPLLYHYYSDDANVPAGINKFDLHHVPVVGGKPADYRSDRKGPHRSPRPIGSRMGPQNMICCGWALQALREHPGVWERPYRERFAKDLRVYFRLDVPTGDAPPAPMAKLSLGHVKMELWSTRTAMRLSGLADGEAKIELFDRPDCKGRTGVVTIAADGSVSAVNGEGEALRVGGGAWTEGGKVAFNISLPYTVTKGQAEWINGVEHGRYSIRVAPASRNLYLASSERGIRAWLTHELAGGLRTWQAIFDAKGFIPTGLGTHMRWDGCSDSGGYAHLLSAASQWLLLLQDKRDWKQHNVPDVLAM